jgi:hypothetical protein
LEDKLQQLSYTLEPFSEENQIKFLTKFWRLKYRFTEAEVKGQGKGKNKLQIYAEHLIKKLEKMELNFKKNMGSKRRVYFGRQ